MLTALVLPVPEAAPVAEGWLERTALSKPSHGMPTHVTVLIPFLPPAEVDGEVVGALRDLFAGVEPFGFTLPGCARFPTTLYLVPEPSAPFAALTEAVVGRWPACRPYGGQFDELVPHLTVAQGEAGLLDAAEAEVAPRLPLASRATEVLLLEQTEPLLQGWDERARFPLGG